MSLQFNFCRKIQRRTDWPVYRDRGMQIVTIVRVVYPWVINPKCVQSTTYL